MLVTIEKPCIKKCCLNEDDICLGCFRTLDDMRCWHTSSLDEKVKMLTLAQKRQKEHKINQKVR